MELDAILIEIDLEYSFFLNEGGEVRNLNFTDVKCSGNIICCPAREYRIKSGYVIGDTFLSNLHPKFSEKSFKEEKYTTLPDDSVETNYIKMPTN